MRSLMCLVLVLLAFTACFSSHGRSQAQEPLDDSADHTRLEVSFLQWEPGFRFLTDAQRDEIRQLAADLANLDPATPSFWVALRYHVLNGVHFPARTTARAVRAVYATWQEDNLIEPYHSRIMTLFNALELGLLDFEHDAMLTDMVVDTMAAASLSTGQSLHYPTILQAARALAASRPQLVRPWIEVRLLRYIADPQLEDPFYTQAVDQVGAWPYMVEALAANYARGEMTQADCSFILALPYRVPEEYRQRIQSAISDVLRPAEPRADLAEVERMEHDWIVESVLDDRLERIDRLSPAIVAALEATSHRCLVCGYWEYWQGRGLDGSKVESLTQNERADEVSRLASYCYVPYGGCYYQLDLAALGANTPTVNYRRSNLWRCPDVFSEPSSALNGYGSPTYPTECFEHWPMFAEQYR